MVNSDLNGLPAAPAKASYSTRQISTSAEYSSTSVKEEGGQQTTVTARLSTAYSYTETRYTPSSSNPVVTYQAPQNLPATEQPNSQSANTGANTSAGSTGAVEANPVGASQNPGAATIVAFVDQRLATDVIDGSTTEELQSRLQAGLDGFIQGYTEAVDQLTEMGLFEGDVKATIEDMFNQVIAGIGELAEKYGLENPAADIALYEAPAQTANPAGAAPVAEQAIISTSPVQAFEPYVDALTANQEAENFNTLIAPSQDFYARMEEEQSESRLYSLSLRTQDGDVVTIRSYSDQGSLQRSGDDAGGGEYETDALQDFRISVNGDLDAGEMSAITDLLSQLNDVADEFFEGDIYEAYEKAQDVGFNAEEIARFSLNLSQVEYSRIESAYGSVAQADTDKLNLRADNVSQNHSESVFDNPVGRMSDFIQHLDNLRNDSHRKGFEERELPAMAEFVGRQKHEQHPHFDQFKPFVGDMMGALRNIHT